MKKLLTVSVTLVNRLRNLSLGYGALAGGLLTAPLVGLLYLVDKLADLPFVPFALFDWIARVLPGPLVTFGIDLMIDGLRLVGLSVAAAAKTGEQAAAILLFYFLGVGGGILFFGIAKARSGQPRLTAGLLAGALFGFPLLAVTLPMGQSTVNPIITLVVLMVLFLAWGISLVPIYGRLVAFKPELPEAEEEVRSVSTIDRRQFLIRLGATTATITVLGGGLGAILAQNERRQIDQAVASSMDKSEIPVRDPFPNAGDPLVPAPGTRSEYTEVEDHYQVFLRTEPTFIDIATWSLPITGKVANPLVLTLDEIRAYESRDQYITLSCISGRIGTTLISTTRWTGVSLQKILADVQPLSEARYLIITSGDGFYETVDLELIASDERIMLAYAWDGEPIPFDHGFPLRIWLPDRYGMKQPKWITGMELVKDYQEGYWVERSWDEVAQVKATSVIDTVAVNNIIKKDNQKLVPVGGIAFAGDRGISKVEVRVDGGPWEQAQLRAPLSETTWVIWRYDWPFQEGEHTFEVRCAEADGTPQIEEKQGNRPDGASGIHSRKTDM